MIEDAELLLESLYEVIENIRLASSEVKLFSRFSLVAAILMFADSVPDGIGGLEKRLRYMTDRF